MSAADPGGGPDQDRFLGFRTFADDTLRPSDEPLRTTPAAAYPAYDDLRVDHRTVYEPYDEAAPARRSIWLMTAGFIGLALLVGTGVALTRGVLGERPRPPAQLQASAAPVVPTRPAPEQTAAALTPAPASVEAGAPAHSPPPPRLDNLRVAAAGPLPRGATVTNQPARVRPADPIGEALAKVLNEPLAPQASEPEAPAPASVLASGPRPRDEPSFDCRFARSYAQQMVCDDPSLAAADRRMNRAYARAMAAGVPERELRAEQNDWLDIREDAARQSPQAVRSVYEQRIDELQALAADGLR